MGLLRVVSAIDKTVIVRLTFRGDQADAPAGFCLSVPLPSARRGG